MASLEDLAPASRYTAVTPSDTATIEPAARALYVGGAGNVTLVSPNGPNAPCLFVAVQAGTILPCDVSQVRATGTTATAIVALF